MSVTQGARQMQQQLKLQPRDVGDLQGEWEPHASGSTSEVQLGYL